MSLHDLVQCINDKEYLQLSLEDLIEVYVEINTSVVELEESIDGLEDIDINTIVYANEYKDNIKETYVTLMIGLPHVKRELDRRLKNIKE